MEQTTLGAVAESQQNISTIPAQTAEPVQQFIEQNTVAIDNGTGTSSSVSQQPTETVTAVNNIADNQVMPQQENYLEQISFLINEGKDLGTIADEYDKKAIVEENAATLNSIINEQTKELSSTPEEVKTEQISSVDNISQLDEEIQQGLEDIQTKKDATEMAKKVYLAFQKERSIHQFDNEQNKNTIEVLKGMIKKLNEQVATTDNDPRITKLDDEMYTLHKLEEAYKKDKSDVSRNNLTRYYVAKLATLNPVMNANKIMDIFNGNIQKQNTIGANIPASTPVVEPKKQAPRPMGIPASKRGMF